MQNIANFTTDLPGCMTQGETIAELIKMVEDAKRAWILTALEDGKEIPKPRQMMEVYSGRFVVRISRTLHRQLVENAKKEGISLNQYVVQLLAQALGSQQQKTQMQQMIIQTISAITQPQV